MRSTKLFSCGECFCPVPWASIVILEAVAVVTLVTTVLVLAWLLRRIGLAAVLRTGEE